MSTSGSTDFNLNTNELIDEAFDILGIGSEGESISDDMYRRAKRSLNLIIKTWGTQDHLWLRTERTLSLVADQAAYALSPKPMRVESVRRKVSNLETPLNMFSRQEYFDMPNKSAASIPVSYYYDPQSTTGTLYLWPAPSAATASTTTLNITYLRRMEDFDGTGDDADMPQEWLEALAYALAVPLALKYTPAKYQLIKSAADEKFAILKAWDNEPASIYLQPDMRR